MTKKTKSNGISKLNGASHHTPVLQTSLETKMEEARIKAEGKGHHIEAFRKNGEKYPVYIAGCTHCLAQIVLDPLKDSADGVAVFWPCDPAAADKRLEFTHEELSAEDRARINAPWKPPCG